MAREIPLTRGMVALVDDGDYPLVATRSWQARHHPRQPHLSHYAIHMYRDGEKMRGLYMHRLILSAAPGVLVDHRNGDALDNRRSNLRLCTSRQNNGNRSINCNSTTGFKGVVRSGKRFRASIGSKTDRVKLGCFSDPIEAALAYDAAARARWGEFARLNFALPGEQSAIARVA